MAQYAFNPANYDVGEDLSTLPFEHILGPAPDTFEIVEEGGVKRLRVVISSTDENIIVFTGIPASANETESLIIVEQQDAAEERFFSWGRAFVQNGRNGAKAGNLAPSFPEIWIGFYEDDSNDGNASGTSFNYPNSFRHVLRLPEGSGIATITVEDLNGTVLATESTPSNIGTSPGREGLGFQRPQDTRIDFMGWGTLGDPAPEPGDEVQEPPVEAGTRVNFPSLPVTATITSTGGISAGDQIVEVSSVDGWGLPPMLVALGNEEPFDVALVLDIDGLTVTLKRDFVEATTPASHASGVAIRPALIGDQIERIYSEFAAIAGVLDGYNAPAFPETGDPNQSWTT